MFVKASHFRSLGGFEPTLRKWGHEDVEISLRNYLTGGVNVADPRIVIYHYYKDLKEKKRAFTITCRETFFNALFVARTYFPAACYQKAKEALGAMTNIDGLVGEVEGPGCRPLIDAIQARLVRRLQDWASEFAEETAFMQEVLRDGGEAKPGQAAYSGVGHSEG